MKKILFAALVLLVCASCHRHHDKAWTHAYYKTIYPSIDAGNRQVLTNDSQRKALTDYEVANLEKQLPDGLDGISKDSLQRVLGRIATQYDKIHPMDDVQGQVDWTNATESSLKQDLLQGDLVKNMDKAAKGKFCDCFVKELKKAMPDKLVVPVPDSVYVNIIATCDAEAGVKGGK